MTATRFPSAREAAACYLFAHGAVYIRDVFIRKPLLDLYHFGSRKICLYQFITISYRNTISNPFGAVPIDQSRRAFHKSLFKEIDVGTICQATMAFIAAGARGKFRPAESFASICSQRDT
ncbi:MAG: hypothetical protein ACLUEQ_02390 [Cloacibacillus evryensis]